MKENLNSLKKDMDNLKEKTNAEQCSFPSTPSPLARRLDLSRKRNTTISKSFLIHHNGFELKTSIFMFTYEDNVHLKPFNLDDQGDFTEPLRSCEQDGGKASAM